MFSLTKIATALPGNLRIIGSNRNTNSSSETAPLSGRLTYGELEVISKDFRKFDSTYIIKPLTFADEDFGALAVALAADCLELPVPLSAGPAAGLSQAPVGHPF